MLSALADLPSAEQQPPAGRARVLVGSAALLAAAGIQLPPAAESHMTIVQVSLPARQQEWCPGPAVVLVPMFVVFKAYR